MPKLHMRLSVELDVPDDLFVEIIKEARYGTNHCGDMDYGLLPLHVQRMIDIKEFETCDWDDGGYCPGDWLEYDAAESGLYEVDERGVRRKDGAE